MKLKANKDPIDLSILMQWMKVKTCIIKTHVHPKYLFTVCKTFHVDDNNIQWMYDISWVDFFCIYPCRRSLSNGPSFINDTSRYISEGKTMNVHPCMKKCTLNCTRALLRSYNRNEQYMTCTHMYILVCTEDYTANKGLGSYTTWQGHSLHTIYSKTRLYRSPRDWFTSLYPSFVISVEVRTH